MVYYGKNSSFKDLLPKDKAVSIHIKHSDYLAMETDKVKKNVMSPILMNEVFTLQENKIYE